ncbi:peroxidase 64-like [Lycium ferocissimum]|uniref:peroxidase 64-like n=1 Tax=Lycium ferocissimum TaxID=112874 RepID=UPI0028161C4E|nr:peroxidase 64-like [Lycium ferocissimum]
MCIENLAFGQLFLRWRRRHRLESVDEGYGGGVKVEEKRVGGDEMEEEDMKIKMIKGHLMYFLGNALSSNYYENTCPQVEDIVTQVVTEASKKDKTIPATLLRVRRFSVTELQEKHCRKRCPPNVSLHAFYFIDSAKKVIEALCPGIVSCADILAFAARDSVVIISKHYCSSRILELKVDLCLVIVSAKNIWLLEYTESEKKCYCGQSGGPFWDVPKGRKDGRTSRASETRQLPAPTFNISQLQQSFSQRGLSLEDLVALSGGHTLGFSHCSSFSNRIHNFNTTHDVDPTLHPSLAATLKGICPLKNRAKNAGIPMDPSSTTFDNTYYKLILQKKSLFSSDQALLSIPKTKSLVSEFASSKEAFFKAFANSMIKMSSINGGREVRRVCRVAK